MKAPQIIWFVIAALNILLSSILHGKPKEEKHNGFTAITGTALNALLLWWGGFFG